MKRPLSLAFTPFLLAQASPPPLVPEGTHQAANGSVTYCGVTAASAAEFERQVTASPRAKKIIETDKFVGYEGPADVTMWVFAKPGATAFPLATCRYLEMKDGATFMGRVMRCDDTRDRCDRAFLEFQGLDQAAKRSVQGQ